MRNTLFVWLFCIFVLTGCITNYPKDIAVVSIKVVDNREQAELPVPPAADEFRPTNPYRDFLLALAESKGDKPIKPDDMAVYFSKQETNQSFKNAKPQKLLFRLEFSSKENLHQFARDHSYPVGVRPYFCARPDDLINWRSKPFWNGLAVGMPWNYEMQKKDGVFVYYFFLDVSYTVKSPTSSYESFDLRTHPEDICFRVSGGFAGRGYKSNNVVVPKFEIIKALKNLPPELRAIAVQ